jgi:uncharacterized repeat protein (TIGR03803 family)
MHRKPGLSFTHPNPGYTSSEPHLARRDEPMIAALRSLVYDLIGPTPSLRTMRIRYTLSLLLFYYFHASAQSPRLWGMATGGGANNKGTIFHIDADGTDFVKVFDFDDPSGWNPEAGLCLAPNGKLYGTTSYGGSGNAVAGTLFSFDPNGGGFHKIEDFDIANGGGNWGSLVLGNDGLLYGGQYMSGAGGGSIYSVDPSNDTYTIVHGLNTSTAGSGITDKLIVGSDGWLYGTAHYGGAFNVGTIFRFDPANQVFETLHDFTGEEGGDTPYGGVCEADNGWLYGTTFTGGLNLFGIIYKYNPTTDQFVTLAALDTIPGSNCWTSMVNTGSDMLIGTVATGGQYSAGFLYGITPSTDAFSEVFPFTPLNGGNQLGNDIVGTDGLVYGLCQAGGTSGGGTVYKFDPVSHAMTVLHSFDLANDGGAPRGDLVEAGTAVGLEEQERNSDIGVWPNPTTGPVTVTCSGPVMGRARYTISDALGRVILIGVLTGGSTWVDLPVAPGDYALTVTSDVFQRTVRVVKDR